MKVLDAALIRTSMHLPDVDGPVWYGMPVIQAISARLTSRGLRVENVEQYEDADGGMWCYLEKRPHIVHVIFVDENLWLVRTEYLRGCLPFFGHDPERLKPMVALLDDALREIPQVELLGWVDDSLGSDPADRPRSAKPF